MTINELLSALRAADAGAMVFFDFGGLMPTDIDSYRGLYDHPALGWAASEYWGGKGGLIHDQFPTVGSLISVLEAAIKPGTSFAGWKGGDFSYNGDEELYVDNQGECNGVVIADVDTSSYKVVLRTRWSGDH